MVALMLRGRAYGRMGKNRKPLTIVLSAPTEGAVMGDSVTLTAVPAGGRLPYAGVQFLLDGVTNIGTVAVAPYTMTWDTTSTANGNHTITAGVVDLAGSTASAVKNVVVARGAAAILVGETNGWATEMGYGCASDPAGGRRLFCARSAPRSRASRH